MCDGRVQQVELGQRGERSREWSGPKLSADMRRYNDRSKKYYLLNLVLFTIRF